MTTFYFIRHGETEWNAKGDMYCGLTNISLSDYGKEQVIKNKYLLNGIEYTRAISSPLLRAKQTAELMSGNTNFETDKRVIEVDFGQWEGLTKPEVWKRFPDNWKKWVNLKEDKDIRIGNTGETYKEIKNRALDFIFDFSDNKEENILVFSHNTFIRLLLVSLLEIPNCYYRRIKIDNASITKIDINGGNIRIDYINKY
ncbi:histidine phosphatase family protein [Mammaliicoccus lentus]|uniref:histidine phosphatase family protein n=1 Tax=Mammaliicoccus lentus TaxID=42858 RepID=UPI003A599B99